METKCEVCGEESTMVTLKLDGEVGEDIALTIEETVDVCDNCADPFYWKRKYDERD